MVGKQIFFFFGSYDAYERGKLAGKGGEPLEQSRLHIFLNKEKVGREEDYCLCYFSVDFRAFIISSPFDPIWSN